MLCLCALLFLYGCGTAQPRAITLTQIQSALAEPISADICIQTEKVEVEGRLERTGPEMYSFVVYSPQSLEGLSMNFQQQKLHLGYRGTELELEAGVLPGEFALTTLNQMLDGLLRQQEYSLVNTSDGGGTLSGKLFEKNFEMTLDPQCRPVSFSLPQENITVQWLEKNA